ncbi:hypothetical protein [Pseudanabaena sp. FACHB-2040]|uniref:hypothetical protein n=1 Tax=Pseudanabaena sp. FACHB-2040 TaxID=2692859 RepID=UPI001681C7D6|nr:hypothetical protein [Pseudanabaena sp. FACHB-2040]MBD2258734.1 hypothetical protein [Pseudanabaena sp. FACHB-2040]
MSKATWSGFELAVALGIGTTTAFAIVNAGISAAVQYSFTEPQFDFYEISGTFEVEGTIGRVLSGTFSSTQTTLIDLTGLEFDGAYLSGTTLSGSEFSTLEPSGGPFGGRRPQLVTLAPQDTVPGGFTGFSTPGYVYEKVSEEPVSTPESAPLVALGLVMGALAGMRALNT